MERRRPLPLSITLWLLVGLASLALLAEAVLLALFGTIGSIAWTVVSIIAVMVAGLIVARDVRRQRRS